MARVVANRSEGIRSEIVEGELEVVAVIRGRASRSDPRNGRREPEVVENAGGDLGVGDKREHAKRIAAARALGDVVPENPAQESGPRDHSNKRARERDDGARRLAAM